MSSVATAMLVDMPEKRVVLNLLFLSAGPCLESCLEESRGCATAAGWCRYSDIDGVRLGVDPTALGVPSWDVPTAARVLLPRVHDELGGSQQTLQRRLV